MKKLLGLFALAILLGFAGCSSDGGGGNGGTDPDPPIGDSVLAAQKISEGWTSFEASPPDYNAALASFSEAIQAKSDTAEAYVGRGWSYAMLAFGSNDLKYNSAVSDFNKAKLYDSDAVDAWAGLAMTQYVTKDYGNALIAAEKVLELDSGWLFTHKTDINSIDINLVRAQIYYHNGNYSKVVEILDELQPGVPHDSQDPGILIQQLMELWGS